MQAASYRLSAIIPQYSTGRENEEKLEAWKTCQYQRDHNTPIRCHPRRTETQEDQEKKQPQQKSQEGPGDSTPAATEINEGDQPLLEHRDTVTTNDSSKNVPDSTGDAQTSVGTHGVSNSAQLPCIVSGDAL